MAQDVGGSTPAVLATAGADASASRSDGRPGAGPVGTPGGGASAAAMASGSRCRAGAWLGGSLGAGAGIAGIPEGGGDRGAVSRVMREAGGVEVDGAGVVDDGSAAGLGVRLAVFGSTDGRGGVVAGGASITLGTSVSTTSGGAVASTGRGVVGRGGGSACAGSAPRNAPAATTPSIIARSQNLT